MTTRNVSKTLGSVPRFSTQIVSIMLNETLEDDDDDISSDVIHDDGDVLKKRGESLGKEKEGVENLSSSVFSTRG